MRRCAALLQEGKERTEGFWGDCVVALLRNMDGFWGGAVVGWGNGSGSVVM